MADEVKANVYQEVSFGKTGSDSSESINVSLDSDANGDKSSFNVGDTAFIAVHRNPRNPYQMFKSAGTLAKVGTDIPVRVTDEILIFANAKEVSLSNFPYGSVSYSFIGNSPGTNPSFDGKRVFFSKDVVAVLVVSYDYLIDRWALTYNSAGTVIVVGIMNQASSYTSIVFGAAAGGGSGGGGSDGGGSGSGEDSTVNDYVIEVRDYCTDSVVAGANVFINGVLKGATNGLGQINVGTLNKGTKYALRIEKSGYTPSDQDSLKNDSFTVPE